ncbi:hypothetical protein EHV15_35450 [Paenibacillus oralis]|uniref:Uncharacterized protein n=1 Tax=Paenibacillus oralis TaxID=2490856 RepID=A0A3P3TAE8_9BACL|nr:hypothetical protein [Paenibacillus oralis]RRJ54872.1 hypothetical protein EHV15_35450 [Paenibacillus oralis]
MRKIIANTLFYFIIVGLLLLIITFVGIGLKEVASWFSLIIPAEHQMYWGTGATLFLIGSFMLMYKLEKAQTRRRLSKIYPITNENMSVFRKVLILCVETHISYLMGFLEGLKDHDDNESLKKLYDDSQKEADSYKGILNKLKSEKEITNDELAILNELYSKKLL